MNQPLVRILAAFILGILFAECREASPILFMALVPLLLCCSPFLKRPFSQTLLLGILFVSLGALAETLMMHWVLKDHILRRCVPDQESTLVGRVISFPEIFPDKTRLLLSAESYGGREVSGIVLLSIYTAPRRGGRGERLDPDYGDRLEVTGKFRPPRRYGNPGALNYISFLKRKGVRVVGSTSLRHVRVLEKGRGNPLMAWLLRAKKDFHIFLEASLPETEAVLIKAMITGDRGGVASDLRERFARAGAAHLLAISGLHMGFVTLFCYQFFLILFRFVLPEALLRESFYWTIPSRLASIMTLLFIPFYTVVAGGRTSSIRAAVMIMVFLVARILERERDLIRTVVLAALVLLIWRPSSLFEVDFQLSFAAVTAMVLFFRHLQETRNDPLRHSGRDTTRKISGIMNRGLVGMARLLLMSFLAVTATAPITAATFHRVSLVGIFTNLVFVPLTGLWIVPCGLAALLLHTVYAPLAWWPARIAGLGCSLLVRGVNLCGSLNRAAVWVFPPSGIWIALYYLFFFLLLVLPRPGPVRRSGRILVLCLFFFAGNAWTGKIRADGLLHIRFLDVGQGASTVLVLPDAATVLIDGGGSYGSSYDVGRKVVLPALLAQGIGKIDVMVLTHPHPDHLNGLIDILEEIPVGEVWDVWEDYPSENYRRFRKILRDRRIPRRFLHRNFDTIRMGGVLFRVLNHGSGFTSRPNSAVNNGSLVLKVTYGDVGFLMTGDLEAGGERTLVDKYPESLRSRILQVPHHGSLTSSDPVFLDAVRPEIAVVQVGAYNRFRFPSSEVLGRYAYIFPEKKILKTDREGAIWIRTDGKTIHVRTFPAARPTSLPGGLRIRQQ